MGNRLFRTIFSIFFLYFSTFIFTISFRYHNTTRGKLTYMDPISMNTCDFTYKYQEDND